MKVESGPIDYLYIYVYTYIYMWIASAESWSVRGASHQPIFMGDCLTIFHMYLPCLPS